MRTLSTESFSRIVPLTRDNYANLHARLTLKLPEQTARIFSRFTLQPSTGSGQWSVNMDCEGDLRPYTEADPLQRDQISMALRSAQTEIKKAFGPQAKMMEQLLEIPDEGCIFFAPSATPGRPPVVVLTQWGFRRVRAGASESLLKLCLDRANSLSSNPVEIHIVYSDGIPAANTEFYLDIFGKSVPFTTDADGLFSPGHVVVGKEFSVRNTDGAISIPFTVVEGQTRYEVVLPKSASLTVKVVQAPDDTPVAGHSVTVGVTTLLTDAEGVAVFGPFPFSGEEPMMITAQGVPPVNHILQVDNDKNQVIIRLEAEAVPEPPEVPLQTPPVQLRIIDKKGIPMVGMNVLVEGKKFRTEMTTDQKGVILLPPDSFLPGEKPRVQLKYPRPDKKK